MASIASSIDGRLRVRAPELRGTSVLGGYCSALEEISGVTTVTCNARTGSLLVLYTADRLPRTDLEMHVRRLLQLEGASAANSDDEFDAVADSPAEQRGGRKWRLARRDVNRYAKFGATACMAVSLLAILARQRRLHVWSGVAALALTGVHMAIHRKTLLR